MDPPPGAGDSEAVSLAKPSKVIPTSFASFSFANRYSIIFSLGLNGFRSSSPKDFIAITTSSSSEMPTERCCLRKKYLPASVIALRGINPTSSEPVTRIPRSWAFRHDSSKATCTGVILILVRFIETWAMPYSSMNQPIALQAFNEPSFQISLPFSSFLILPVTKFPSRTGRPFSRISNATALALRTEVVLRLML